MIAEQKIIKFEYRLISVVFLLAVGLAFVWPEWVLYGYLFPLLLVGPIANTMRTMLEHSEYDASNPFQLGCFYRTGPLTKLLFFWDSGDCHFVHHIFPGIPYYRISAALRDMRPIFLEHEVIERRSLLALLWVWFKAEFPYRTPRVMPVADKPV